MNIKPIEIHCGDKFSIIVGVVNDPYKPHPKLTPKEDLLSEMEENVWVFTEDEYHDKIDDHMIQMQKNDKESGISTSNKNEKKAITHKFSMSSSLLSLVARASRLTCMTATDDSHACSVKYSPYGIEFKHITYGCILTLLEKYQDMFCYNLELLLNENFMMNENKKKINQNIKKVFKLSEEKNDLLVLHDSYGNLLSSLTILQSNLSILSIQIIKDNLKHKNGNDMKIKINHGIEKKDEKNENDVSKFLSRNSELIENSVFHPHIPGWYMYVYMHL